MKIEAYREICDLAFDEAYARFKKGERDAFDKTIKTLTDFGLALPDAESKKFFDARWPTAKKEAS